MRMCAALDWRSRKKSHRHRRRPNWAAVATGSRERRLELRKGLRHSSMMSSMMLSSRTTCRRSRMPEALARPGGDKRTQRLMRNTTTALERRAEAAQEMRIRQRGGSAHARRSERGGKRSLRRSRTQRAWSTTMCRPTTGWMRKTCSWMSPPSRRPLHGTPVLSTQNIRYQAVSLDSWAWSSSASRRGSFTPAGPARGKTK